MKLKKLKSVNFEVLKSTKMNNTFGGRKKYCVNTTNGQGSADRMWYYSDDDCYAGSWTEYDSQTLQ